MGRPDDVEGDDVVTAEDAVDDIDVAFAGDTVDNVIAGDAVGGSNVDNAALDAGVPLPLDAILVKVF